MLDTKNYKVVEFSWEEKRQDLFDGVDTLPTNLRSRPNAMPGPYATPPELPPQGPASQANRSKLLIIFSESMRKTGAINRLRNKSHRPRVGRARPPNRSVHLSDALESGLRALHRHLCTSPQGLGVHDYGKPNIERFGAVTRNGTRRQPTSIWKRQPKPIASSPSSKSRTKKLSIRPRCFPKAFLELVFPSPSPSSISTFVFSKTRDPFS